MDDPIQTASAYHRATEYDRHAMQGHYLDWPNQPDVYKKYPGIRPLDLPRIGKVEGNDLWRLSDQNSSGYPPKAVNPQLLATLLQQSYGLTARTRHPGQEFYYRSVASAGALYPTELYLAASSVSGLEAGLYHYEIAHNRLIPLRGNNPAHWVSQATNVAPEKRLAATFLITGILFRSAWKYRARAYRYILLDAGHLMENLVLASKSLSLPFSFGFNFDDRLLEKIIGIDGRKEVCLGYLHLYDKESSLAASDIGRMDLSDDFKNSDPVSPTEVVYPEIEKIHRSGITAIVGDHRKPESHSQLGIEPDRWWTIAHRVESTAVMEYPEIVYKRRSRRNFVNREVPKTAFDDLVGLVSSALRRPETGEEDGAALVKVGLLSGHVENVCPGFYLLDPENRRIGLAAMGDKIREMATVCLDQEWLANSALHFLFMTNLDFIDRSRGARGYRHALMTAGRLGQAIYLGATALGLGCCGIGALYDGEARALLGLNDESALLYVVAVGAVKR